MKTKLDVSSLLWGAAAGAIGGAVGWLPGELFAMPQPSQAFWHYLLIVFYFLVISGSIGAAIGALDGIYSGLRQRAIHGAQTGALLGMIGGAVGSLPGELIFQLLSDFGLGVLGRALGWGLIGSVIGLTQGLSADNRLRMVRGALGGLLGGYLGGGCFELISQLWAGGAVSRWVAVVLLGTCVGALIVLIRTWLSAAYLIVTSGGPHEGKRLPLEKNETWIGRAESDDLSLHQGSGIVAHHARITRKANGYWIAAGQVESPLMVNDQRLLGEQRLRDGQTIHIGNQQVRFFEQTAPCARCGQENGSYAQFCVGCGKTLSRANNSR